MPYSPLKVHGVVSQKRILFITTVRRTTNPAINSSVPYNVNDPNLVQQAREQYMQRTKKHPKNKSSY
jgi:hypothetical protein